MVIWSSNAIDSTLDLSYDEKLKLLLDRGYDAEFLSSADLDEIIASEETMWQENIDEFEEVIVPMIEAQTYMGWVILAGDSSRWDGTRQTGLVKEARDLLNLDRDLDSLRIEDDGDGLVLVGTHHDGSHALKMYAIPESKEGLDNFGIETGAIELLKHYDMLSEDDETFSKWISTASIEDLNNVLDVSVVPDVCERIKNLNVVTENLKESVGLNEVKSNTPELLKVEYDEIKPLADEYGAEYFTSMPFTAYDNDPESIEYKYPNFFKVVKAFFKEMGILSKEELEDTDVLDEMWYTDINQHDWDTLMRTCDLLINKPHHSAQIEKVYTLDFDDGLGNAKSTEE